VIAVPGRSRLELTHLLLDVNGTVTDHGVLIDGVAERLVRLAASLEVHLLSADTFGSLAAIAAELGLEARTVASGEEKAGVVSALGRDRCVAIGNGANDEEMLRAAALGIAVLGPEGASSAALRAADVVCPSVLDALDLLLDDRALTATLRS
jgi:P-type E1-E2 ATPase